MESFALPYMESGESYDDEKKAKTQSFTCMHYAPFDFAGKGFLF